MRTNNSGRPVRFFVLLMSSWAAVRFFSAMNEGLDPPVSPAPDTRTPSFAGMNGTFRHIASRNAIPLLHQRPHPLLLDALSPKPIRLRHRSSLPVPTAVQSSFLAYHDASPGDAFIPSPALPPGISAASANPGQSTRWRGSAWTLWREGSSTSADATPIGRLGGSQAGMRLDYDLTPHAQGRITAYGRFSAALNSPASPESALGVSWQPIRTLSITFAAERRIAAGRGARDANALLAVGGFGPTQLLPGLEAEAYAQGGVVGFRARDLFADGKFSLLTPIAKSPLKLGASISGGAQPSVERQDIGPEIQLRLPLPRLATRLSLEWRSRVAGHAAPPSGLAVTLGADF